jgi:hypothetical protein
VSIDYTNIPEVDSTGYTRGAHARRFDPASSHEAVGHIAKARTLHELVRDAGASLKEMFSDTDLWVEVERVSGRRQQRNVIARTRGLHTAPHGPMSAWFEGVGSFRQDGKLLEHYRFIGDNEETA